MGCQQIIHQKSVLNGVYLKKNNEPGNGLLHAFILISALLILALAAVFFFNPALIAPPSIPASPPSPAPEAWHACRMWGITGDVPSGVIINHLVDAPSSIKNLSATSNLDGWGVASYANYGDSSDIQRGMQRAYNSDSFTSNASALDSTPPKIALAHVRACTSGCCDPGGESINNPHPFTRNKNGKDWVFEHNGGIDIGRANATLGADYLAANPRTCSYVCNDATNQSCDSEYYFLVILKYIEADNWHVIDGIADGTNALIAAGEGGAMNFVLSDGEGMWAYRRGDGSHTLYYLYNSTDAAHAWTAVASNYTGASQGDWVEMASRELLAVSGNGTPTIFDTATYVSHPSITIASPANGTTYPSATILLNISSNGNSTWYNWNGTNYTYSAPINVTFNNSTIVLTAWTNSSGGNTNTTNATFTVSIIPSYDDVHFNSTFQSGNLYNVQYVGGDAAGNRTYSATTNYTSATDDSYHWWYFFKMTNASGKNVRINLTNLAPSDFNYRWPSHRPRFSYDFGAGNVDGNSADWAAGNWTAVSPSSISYNSSGTWFSFNISSSQNTTWVAANVPYTVLRRDRYLASIAGSPYVNISAIANTTFGLNLSAVEITDSAFPSAGKAKIYVVAQQHANEESQGSWMTEGAIDFLLDPSNATAAALRANYRFKFVPILNVDGVYNGTGRFSPYYGGTTQWDPNREWDNARRGEATYNVVNWTYLDIGAFSPNASLDLHGSLSGELPHIPIGVNYVLLDKEADAVTNALSSNLSANVQYVYSDWTRVTNSQSMPVNAYSGWGAHPSLTFEFSSSNVTPTAVMNNSDWRNFGKGMLLGIHGYYGLSTQLPALAIVCPANTTYTNATQRLNITNSSAAAVWYNWNGTNVTYNASPLINFTQGSHTLSAWANDSAGNLNTANVTFFIDSISPSISFAFPSTSTGNKSQNWIAANVSANDTYPANITISLYKEGVLVGTATNATSTLFKNFTGLSDGSYEANATAFDAAGNSGRNSSGTIVLDSSNISASSISPSVVINGSAVNLYVNASHADSISANVTLPDGSIIAATLSNNANTSFANTSAIGTYNVTFIAMRNGTAFTANRSFSVFPPVVFNVTVVDYDSSGVNSSLTLYYRNESIAANSSPSGNYNATLPSALLDLEFKSHADKFTVLLRDINISSDNNKTFGIGQPNVSGYIASYSVSNSFNFAAAAVTLCYNGTSYTNESYLYLHKCDSFNFANRSCTGTWSNVTVNATQNLTSHCFSLPVSSFSGFGVQQGSYCGNGVCSSDKSCSSCPADCGACPANTGGSSGAGSSGGGASGGGSTGSNRASATYQIDVGNKRKCNVSISRSIASSAKSSNLTTTILNVGGEGCDLQEFAFIEQIPSQFAAMDEISFFPQYAWSNGSSVGYSFPVFSADESKTIVYSVGRWVGPSRLQNMTTYSLSAKKEETAQPQSLSLPMQQGNESATQSKPSADALPLPAPALVPEQSRSTLDKAGQPKQEEQQMPDLAFLVAALLAGVVLLAIAAFFIRKRNAQ